MTFVRFQSSTFRLQETADQAIHDDTHGPDVHLYISSHVWEVFL